jgi:hypothetical protein
MQRTTMQRTWVVILLASATMALPHARAMAQNFNAGDIERRLQHLDATPPSNASRATLTVSELQALRGRLAHCWDLPVAARGVRGVVATLHIRFKPDGSLAGQPEVANSSNDPAFPMLAASATRAVTKCAPFSFLPAEKYAAWKEIEVDFDPREMFGASPKQ